MEKITWNIPIKTVSEANDSSPWRERHRRHKLQHQIINVIFRSEKKPIPFPCIVTFTRTSPRLMDQDENLRMAFKYIKDELSDLLVGQEPFYINKAGRRQRIRGRNDSDPRIVWKYAQTASKSVGIKIEIESLRDEELPVLGI